MSEQKPYTDITVERKDGSLVAVTGEIPYEALAPHRNAALAEAVEETELDGFRKGHAPEAKVIAHLGGEEALLWRAAQRAIAEVYPLILREQKIDAIGRPSVTITKLAANNPLGFSIETAVVPDIEPGDYKAAARDVYGKEEAPLSVSDEEIDEVLLMIRRQRAAAVRAELGGTDAPKTDDENLPALDDAFAKQLGGFESVDELTQAVRDNLMKEKEVRAREKQRAEVAERIIEHAEVDIPDLLVNSELANMLGRLSADVERSGASMEQYLGQINKTKEQIEEEWRPEAAKRAKLQLIISEIAKREALTPDPEMLEKEVAHIKEHHPDADDDAVRAYAATALTNEAVFVFLQSQVQKEQAA